MGRICPALEREATMSVLIAFLIIWIAAPGPITMLVIGRTRSQGIRAGIAVTSGVTATKSLILFFIVIVHQLNLSIVELSTSRVPKMISAGLIIVLGMHAGYKALKATSDGEHSQPVVSSSRNNIVQGMLVAVSGVPQAVVFYLILIPQTAAVGQLRNTVAAFGLTQLALTFLWYAAIACAISFVERWLQNPSVSRRFDFATAALMVGVGVNILV